MAIENPVFKRVVAAITPVVSIGVGSAVHTVCSELGLRAAYLEEKDLPALKPALVEHYRTFWAHKTDQITHQLETI